MKREAHLNYALIDGVSELEEAVARLQKTDVLAVDLEGDSMFHFKEKVCLLQVSTHAENLVFDPLRLSDMSPLKPVFADPQCMKIFHGADYDVRSLYRDFGFEINNLFDTELASRFLGIRESGLEATLRSRFGVTLNKRFQKKDWSQRPLPPDMVAYAVADVHYLISLAKMLQEELGAKHRLAWVAEECDLLSRVRPAAADDRPLFLSFKGAGRLSRRSLAVLEALLQFRKEVAEKKDKPLFKVFANRVLMKMALKKPLLLAELERMQILSRKQIKIYGNGLIERIRQGLAVSEEKLPVYPRRKPPVLPPEVPQRVRVLKVWRAKKAADLDLEPGLLCNNALLAAIAMQNPHDMAQLARIDGMKNWQKEALGKEILTVLRKAER